jgi:hypothetical protein
MCYLCLRPLTKFPPQHLRGLSSRAAEPGVDRYLIAGFTYVRLFGGRKGIEKETKTWDKVIVDRKQKLDS